MGSSEVIAQFVYRHEGAGSRLARPASRYLVERLGGSSVVARIGPLGAASTATPSGSAVQWRVVGPWSPSPSRRYSMARLAPDGGRRESRAVVVVETGIDPVTSRFSGARSTN